MKALRVLCAMLLIPMLPMYAQQQMASLTGRITDTSGASVSGAQVTITDMERGTKVVVTSDENGDYTVPQIPPAEHYMLTVNKAGFKETIQPDVVLQVAQSAKIDVIMALGAVTETVNVSAAPPQLDTQTSSLGQVITGQTVEALPLNGRSTFRLIALTPGVTFQRSAFGQFGDVPVNSTWDTNFTINGGRAQSNEVLIDGVPSSAGFFNQITTLPIVDETQEFKVESNNLSAIYGRYSGGAINVTTKSGTNGFHGDLFEFIRNDALDANEWFNKAAGGARNPFRMNQFGGTVGGPVSIPHFYSGRDRTFFFFAYQGTRRTQGSTFTGTVPTAAQRAGDFSALCKTFNSAGVCTSGTQIYNPFSYNSTTKTRAPFAFNQIPSNLFDPVALKMQTYFPLPNAGGPNALTKNFISLSPTILSQDVYSGRVDQNVTKNYHVSGRYAFSTTPLTQPNVYNNVASTGASAVGTTTFRNQSFALDNVYQVSPTLLLNTNYGFARWFQSRQTRSYGFDNNTLGFPANMVQAITIPMFPAVNIGGGYSGLANQSYLSNGNDSHAVLVSVTKLLGKHSLTFGVDGRMHRINFFSVANSAGTYSFAIAQTQGPVPTTATGGNAYASFLLGFGSSGSFPIGSGSELQDFYGAVYAQDDIRLTQRLTVNVGVRYDSESAYTDRHNQLNYFDSTITSPTRNASFPNLAGGLVFADTGTTGRTVYTRQHGNVGPRVGFAFSPQPTTSVRGGFGISYAPLEISSNAVGFVSNLGFSSSTGWNTSNDNGVTPANLLSNPFPQGFSAPTGKSLGAATQLGQAITVWTHNPPTPYSMQWNFDVQQQFPASVLLDVGYSGSRGEHLTGTFDRNTLDPRYMALGSGLNTSVSNPFRPFVQIGTLSNPTVSQRQLLLPYPQFLSVVEVNNPWGDSNYHSLQMKLVKRMSGGLSLLASYTWSKLISNANAQDAPIGPSDNTGVQDYYDLRAERSVSELDQPQNFVLNSVYELPFGHGKLWFAKVPALMNVFVGGWKVTSILTEQSGFPLTLSAAGVGGGTRPNLVPGISPQIQGNRSNQQRVQAWFNTAAFVTPPSYSFGTVRRTFTEVRGPGISNLDASLEKFTKFERLDTEFRVELFNVTNTPHFSMPDMARQDAAFGAISSTVLSPPQREMQLALKINF